MSDLRCRQCGARMQPAAEWCSLCHTSVASAESVEADPTAAVPGPRSAQPYATAPPSRGHRKHAAPDARKPRLASKRSRLITAAVLVAVVGTGTGIALSVSGRSDKAQHDVSPAGKPPSGTTFGVLPGTGTPSNIPLPGRVSR